MAEAQSIAIYYLPDGYETDGRPLMGRRAAGKSFLKAWFRRRQATDLYCHTDQQNNFQAFTNFASAEGATGKAHWLPFERPELLQSVGSLYFPGPDIARNAWRRYRRSPSGWSIIGVTHTICTEAVMDGIAEWLTSPVEDWDAVICTSTAVRTSIEYLLASQRDHLHRRNNAVRFPQPQLPVIPLGIDTQAFAGDAGVRSSTRERLGIGPDDIALLFVGRLSIYGKAHPLPMYIAAQRAAEKSGKKLHLILAGWFATDGIEKMFRIEAAATCPDVQLHVLDGRIESELKSAWNAGDIFLSLVDNIQETFGLTPVEAMAAGKPVVVSDWDGYRDTVRHGIDGFRVPTLSPPSFMGEVLIDRYAAQIDNYDMYLARNSNVVAVDIEAVTNALVTLIEDAELRVRMGNAGQKHACEAYDWQPILARYEELASDLAERRKHAGAEDPKIRRVWPARLSPYELFANYGTRIPQQDDVVALATTDIPASLALLARSLNTALEHPPTIMAIAEAMIEQVRSEVRTAQFVIETGDAKEAGFRLAVMMRLAKFGIVSIAPKSGPAEPRDAILPAN